MRLSVNQGFTIIELMIVVALVGILAALALPMYGFFTARAQVTEGQALLKGLKTPLVEAMSTDSIKECNANAAWFINEVRDGQYVDNIAVSSNETSKQCLMVLTFNNTNVNDGVKGKKISMRYSLNTGMWECGTDLDSTLISAACNNPMLTVD